MSERTRLIGPRRFEVHVTVECTCVIEVTADNEHDAVTEAKARYVREDLEVEPPHAADWSGAEVFPAGSAGR